MSVFVKICGLSTAAGVDAAVTAGANAVGFVFAKSVRRVSPATAAIISNSVPDDVQRVAVMLHPSDAEWQDVLREFRPDVLQTDVSDFAALNVPDGIDRWPVFRQGGMPPSDEAMFVYEGPRSGHGQTVDWDLATKYSPLGNMLLAGGLSTENVASAVAIVQPFGVDVSSAVEVAPGQKGARRIREFISAARAAENQS